MSDPLERLGDLGAGIESPDPATIRSRAQTIVRRRRVAVAASTGAALAAVVVVAAVALPLGREGRQTASETTGESRPAPEVAAPLAEDGDAASSADALTEDEAPPAEAEARTGYSPTSGGTANADASGTGGPPPLSVTVLVSGGATQDRFTLRVCNTSSDRSTSRFFPSAQRFDFEVYAGDAGEGDPVWRWAEGQIFAQVTGRESWEPEECRVDWTVTWDRSDGDGDPVAPGRYEVVGVLTAAEPQRSEPAEVCHVTCG